MKLENLEDFLPELVEDKSINKNVPKVRKIKKPQINKLQKKRKIRNQKCTTENDKETTMADKTAQSENDFVFIPKKREQKFITYLNTIKILKFLFLEKNVIIK